jgi:hypothetical protein
MTYSPYNQYMNIGLQVVVVLAGSSTRGVLRMPIINNNKRNFFLKKGVRVKSLTCVCFRLRALEPTNKGNSQSLTTSIDTICCPHL